MRVAVVDDQASQREGRLTWLSRAGIEAVGLTFEEAIAWTREWQTVDVAVLDAHDRRASWQRRAAAEAVGIEPIAPHDNFIGVRVAEHIRTCGAHARILLVSAYARDNDLRARRIAQAGIDYAFEHYEVDGDEHTFVAAVVDPESVAAAIAQPEVNWVGQGFTAAPDVAAAVREVEGSPAGPMLLADDPHYRHPEQEWAIRQLRNRLFSALPNALPVTAGDRVKRAPSKTWLARQLRVIFAQDLPVDRRDHRPR